MLLLNYTGRRKTTCTGRDHIKFIKTSIETAIDIVSIASNVALEEINGLKILMKNGMFEKNHENEWILRSSF